jgi:hypothetical protein
MAERDVETSPVDAPWMRRKDWACGRIRSVGVAQIVLLWIMAGLWNGFMLTLMIVFWDDPEKKDMLKVLSFFCLIGLCLLVWAVRRTWAWLRFGGSVLELASTPGVIGGTLEGQIQTGVQIVPTKPMQLVLSCIRETRVERGTRSNRENDITRDTLWETDRSVSVGRLTQGPRGLAIPVRIAIPYGLPSSDDSDMDNRIRWQLVVFCDLPGIDFRADFQVPVFVTADSKSDWTEQKVDEMVQQEREAEPSSEPPRAGSWVSPVMVRPTQTGGMEYVFRLDASFKMALGLTLAAVLICAGSVGLYLWLGELGPFAVLPGILGLLFLLASVVIWTFKSRVLIEGDSVTVRKSVLGIPRIWRIPFSQVSGVRVRHEQVEGVKEKDRDWEIEIDRKGEAPVKLGASIRERPEAVRLAEEMRAQIR